MDTRSFVMPTSGLSKTQIEMLMDAHEAELQQREPPLGPYYMKYLKRLVLMGFLSPQDYYKMGKKLLRFYITESGKQFLQTAEH